MYQIGLNTAIATFRKCKIPQSPLEDHHSDAVSVSESTSENEANDKLLYAIRQLNEADRALLTLYFEDISHQEIGDILGISENNVAVRLIRIKERLRTLLNPKP